MSVIVIPSKNIKNQPDFNIINDNVIKNIGYTEHNNNIETQYFYNKTFNINVKNTNIDISSFPSGTLLSQDSDGKYRVKFIDKVQSSDIIMPLWGRLLELYAEYDGDSMGEILFISSNYDDYSTFDVSTLPDENTVLLFMESVTNDSFYMAFSLSLQNVYTSSIDNRITIKYSSNSINIATSNNGTTNDIVLQDNELNNNFTYINDYALQKINTSHEMENQDYSNGSFLPNIFADYKIDCNGKFYLYRPVLSSTSVTEVYRTSTDKLRLYKLYNIDLLFVDNIYYYEYDMDTYEAVIPTNGQQPLQIYEYVSNNIKTYYYNGKQTASLTVYYTEYYDTEGNIVYNGKDGQIIKVGDIVLPMIYKFTGDEPLSTYEDGTPKQFEVMSSELIYANGSIYINLELCEKVYIDASVTFAEGIVVTYNGEQIENGTPLTAGSLVTIHYGTSDQINLIINGVRYDNYTTIAVYNNIYISYEYKKYTITYSNTTSVTDGATIIGNNAQLQYGAEIVPTFIGDGQLINMYANDTIITNNSTYTITTDTNIKNKYYSKYSSNMTKTQGMYSINIPDEYIPLLINNQCNITINDMTNNVNKIINVQPEEIYYNIDFYTYTITSFYVSIKNKSIAFFVLGTSQSISFNIEYISSNIVEE